ENLKVNQLLIFTAMKPIIFILIFISTLSFGQSVTIDPSVADDIVNIRKDSRGLDHRSSNGSVGVGTWVSNSVAYLQTHTNHPLFFSINDSGPKMVIALNGNIGIGGLTNPTAALAVSRGIAPDGTAVFFGTTWASHFNYSTTEDTYIRGGKNASKVLINDLVGLGNVGIGTNNPQQKLDVEGNVRVSALVGSGSGALASDATGTLMRLAPVAFSVKNTGSTAYPVPVSGFTIVPFSTRDYDYGSFFDNTTNYDYNAPRNGIYHFDSFVTWKLTASTVGSYTLSIYVDGSVYAVVQEKIFSNVETTMNLSTDIKLNAGQKVQLRVAQTSGVTQNLLLNAYNTKFSGHFVMPL
ncbi:MAG TPA: hypothetical protein VGE24_15460, partial [Emticicia sp.]